MLIPHSCSMRALCSILLFLSAAVGALASRSVWMSSLVRASSDFSLSESEISIIEMCLFSSAAECLETSEVSSETDRNVSGNIVLDVSPAFRRVVACFL